MTKWNTLRIALGTVALGLIVSASGHAFVGHQNQLTFNKPVALPGVVLPAGSYTFDVASDTALDVVIVRDRARGKLYYMGFTTAVERPAGMSKTAPIAFGEASPNAPSPIATWYEIGNVLGHQFRY